MPDTVTSAQGDTLDDLLWRERGLGSLAIGPALEANPGLADAGAILPAGTIVTVPPAPPANAARNLIQLWD